jgi:hypothetical protein
MKQTRRNIVGKIRRFGISFRSHPLGIPKRRIFPKILRHAETSKSHIISFIVAKALDHLGSCAGRELYQQFAS